MTVSVSRATLDDDEVRAFVRAHLEELAPTGPKESQHALDTSGLRARGVRVWVARDRGMVVGVVALAPLGPGHEELKSMRTHPRSRGQGTGTRLLRVTLDDARMRQIGRISLETGSMDFFAPARALYRRNGFRECDPFEPYVPDPNSVFMTIELP